MKRRRVEIMPDAMQLPQNLSLINDTVEAVEAICPTLNPALGQAEPHAKLKRDGFLAYADGTNWNPSEGKGLYRYDESLSAWVRFSDSGRTNLKVYQSTAQTLPTATWTTVLFDAVHFDVLGEFDTASGKAVVTDAGKYRLKTNIGFSAVPSGSLCAIRIYAGGTAVAEAVTFKYGLSNQTLFVDTTHQLVAGATVEVKAYCGNSVSLLNTIRHTYLIVERVI